MEKWDRSDKNKVVGDELGCWGFKSPEGYFDR